MTDSDHREDAPQVKYTNSIELSLPRTKVARLLADPDLIPKWLRDVVVHEPVQGVHGEVGTRSRVVMRSGDRTMEATETITRREPADLRRIPTSADVVFEREIVGAGMWSQVRDRLTELGPERTLWVSESEYRFDQLPLRLLGLIAPGMFRKQSQQHLEDFKAFAEQGRDVRADDG